MNLIAKRVVAKNNYFISNYRKMPEMLYGHKKNAKGIDIARK